MPPGVNLASLSCSLQVFGTVRLNATMRCNASILRSIALRPSPLALRGHLFSAATKLVAVFGQQADAVGAEQLVVADRRRDRPRVRAVGDVSPACTS